MSPIPRPKHDAAAPFPAAWRAEAPDTAAAPAPVPALPGVAVRAADAGDEAMAAARKAETTAALAVPRRPWNAARRLPKRNLFKRPLRRGTAADQDGRSCASVAFLNASGMETFAGGGTRQPPPASLE